MSSKYRAKRAHAFAFALGIACLGQPALGDDIDDKALDLHKQGVALYKTGQYIEAADAFRQAQALKPTWKLYYNIGQCEAAARRYGMALDAFERYLVEGGDEVPGPKSDEVSAEIRRIKPLVGVVEPIGPDGLEVRVDGTDRGTLPLSGPLRVAAGPHRVELKQGAEVRLEKTIRVAGGITTRVALPKSEGPRQDQAPEPTPAEPARTVPEAPGGGSPLKTVGWIGIGTGAAAAVGGAIAGGVALSKSNELADKCPSKQGCSEDDEPLQESAKSLALTADILIPAGAALVVAGVALLIFAPDEGDESARGMSAHLMPLVDPHRAGLLVTGRF